MTQNTQYVEDRREGVLSSSLQTLVGVCWRLVLAAMHIHSPFEHPPCFLVLPVEYAPLVFGATALIFDKSKAKYKDPCKEIGERQRK